MGRNLILLRGLPGTGKSSFANLLSEISDSRIYSLDEYFTNSSGEYKFNFKENHLAYKNCENNVKSAMQNEIQNIIVDQTFALFWELEPYLSLGKEFGYRTYVCTLENRHSGENIHGITDEQLVKMAKGFQIELLPERLRRNGTTDERG